MIFNELTLKGAFIITPEPFTDNRGFFLRSFCTKEFIQKDLVSTFLQINHSGTKDVGSIRGMHFQYPPYAEVKVVKCIKGAIFDVIIDLRKNSPTFLKWEGIELNERNKQSIYIPQGFAHGFQTLTNDAEIIYLVSQVYNKESEGGIRFSDPAVAINWKVPVATISEKDLSIPYINSSFKGIDI
jgi:dTDP-4-dehydrorhamnose 3,5-epimerase